MSAEKQTIGNTDSLHKIAAHIGLAAINIATISGGVAIAREGSPQPASTCIEQACGQTALADLKLELRPLPHATSPTSIKPTQEIPKHIIPAPVRSSTKQEDATTLQPPQTVLKFRPHFVKTSSISELLGKPGAIGYDVGPPNCHQRLPDYADFAIVSITKKYPGRSYPKCLPKLLRWAEKATGKPAHLYYENIADPGPDATSHPWPRNDFEPRLSADNKPLLIPNTFGQCKGGRTLACAFDDGWNMGRYADRVSFRPAAEKIGISASLAGSVIAFDVEHEGKGAWQTGAFGKRMNQAALLGEVAYAQSVGAYPIIYSARQLYADILGDIPTHSPLAKLALWDATGTNLADAKLACSTPTYSGVRALEQYGTHVHSADIDTNIIC